MGGRESPSISNGQTDLTVKAEALNGSIDARPAYGLSLRVLQICSIVMQHARTAKEAAKRFTSHRPTPAHRSNTTEAWSLGINDGLFSSCSVSSNYDKTCYCRSSKVALTKPSSSGGTVRHDKNQALSSYLHITLITSANM